MSDAVTALQRAAAAQRATRDLRQLRGEYDRVAGRIRGFIAMYTTSDADTRVVTDMVLAEIRPVMQGNLELSHHLVERMEETEGLREEATKLRAWTARAAEKAEAQRAALERLAQAQEQERTTAKMDVLARKDQEMRHRRAWRDEVEATLAQQLRDVAAHLKRSHDAELEGVVKRFESEIREREGTLRAQFEAQLAALEQEIQLQRALRSPLRSQRWERGGSGERVVERVKESEGIRYAGDGRGDRHHADTYRGHDSDDERGDTCTYRGRRDGGRTGAQHQPLRRPFAEPGGSGEDADSGSSGDATVDGKGSNDRSRTRRGHASEGGGSEDGGDSSCSPAIRGVTSHRSGASDVLRRTTAKRIDVTTVCTTGNNPGTTDTTGSPGTTSSRGTPGTDRRIVTGMGWAMRPNLVPRYTEVTEESEEREDSEESEERGDSGGGGERGESKERNGGSPRPREHGYARSPARRLGYDASRRGASRPVGVHSSGVSSGEASPVVVQETPGIVYSSMSHVSGSPDNAQPVTDTAAWARRKAAEDFEVSMDTEAEDREWRRATAWVREGGRSSNTYRSIFAVKGSLAASVTTKRAGAFGARYAGGWGERAAGDEGVAFEEGGVV